METTRGFKFKILLAKAYFDKGYGMTSYLFKLMAVLGVGLIVKENYYIALSLGMIYTISCYFIGRACYKYKIVDTESEINNMFNPLFREMSKKFVIPNN